MNNMTTLLRRETWEHPAIWIVPSAFAAVLLIGQVVALVILDRVAGIPADEIREVIRIFAGMDTPDRRGLLKALFLGGAMPFNIFVVGVMFFYGLDSLYADRRDRSVLFWKSLPVSDVETVMSKLATAMLVIPACGLAVVIAFHLACTVFASVMALSLGAEGWIALWDPVVMLDVWATLLWLLFAQSLVYLPLIAWVMLASAWARKAPFIWAVAPPVGVIIVEMMYAGRTRLGEWLGERVTNGMPLAMQVDVSGARSVRINGEVIHNLPDSSSFIVSFELLASGLLWSGVAIAAVLLTGAVWLRRYRAEAE